MINRRDFLKCSMLSLPAIPLLGGATNGYANQSPVAAADVSTTVESAVEISKISIVSCVDVVGALSDRTLLQGNLCMMDNSPLRSTGQGTPSLCTLCQPGQLISWTIYTLDAQTPVEIRSISFIGAESGGGGQHQISPAVAESDKLHLRVWSGIVPSNMVRGKEYRYRFEVQMNEGKNSVLYVDTPSLKCI